MDRLPLDILLRIFDFLGNGEICASRRVSHVWRDAATTHPLFWRRVVVKSPHMASIRFARLRIAAAEERPFALIVKLMGGLSAPKMLNSAIRFLHRNFLRSLLDLIKNSIKQVFYLRIYVHSRYLSAIYNGLTRPAPHLEQFSLWVIDKPCTDRITCPASIFNSDAVKLRNLFLHNVHLSSPIPAVFRDIRGLVLSYHPMASFDFPPPAISWFPALHELVLHGGHIKFGRPPTREVMAAFSRLDIHMDIGTQAEFHSICLEFTPLLTSLTKLSIWAPEMSVMRRLLEELSPPWRLSFTILKEGEFLIEIISESSSGKQRDFCGHLANVDATFQALLVDNRDFLQHVRHLTLATAVWPAVHSLLPVLENLEEFRVHIDTERLPVEELIGVRSANPPIVHIDLDQQLEVFRLAEQDLQCFLSKFSNEHVSLHVSARIITV